MLQTKATDGPTSQAANKTGMPDQLKTGVEALSGLDMSDVRVHYNSEKPAAVGALAYAQGTDIHLGPGQEKHLPHEAWHVVQQAEGRVRPTMQAYGVAINDDGGLEREADVLGAKALQSNRSDHKAGEQYKKRKLSPRAVSARIFTTSCPKACGLKLILLSPALGRQDHMDRQSKTGFGLVELAKRQNGSGWSLFLRAAL